MPKRQFLMLANNYDPSKGYIAEWYASEKLDGMRVWWDGGITRGILKSLVPWANTSKDDRYVDPPVATGLWTRYGNVIHAPDWWLDKLPRLSLDGELYTPGHRQHMMSTVKKLVPDDYGWESVGFHVFDIVPLATVLDSGIIQTPNSYQYWTDDAKDKFLRGKPELLHDCGVNTPFMTRVKLLERFLAEAEHPVVLHPQTRLPGINAKAREMVLELTDDITSIGGEGLIIRSPASKWMPHRVKDMLKVKPFDDMEVKVVGYTTGKGKHLGRMGALIVESSYGRFSLSGFTDTERGLNQEAEAHAENEPGVDVLGAGTVHFKPGDIVTIKHRGFTADNIPQEARYWRPRNEV